MHSVALKNIFKTTFCQQIMHMHNEITRDGCLVLLAIQNVQQTICHIVYHKAYKIDTIIVFSMHVFHNKTLKFSTK